MNAGSCVRAATTQQPSPTDYRNSYLDSPVAVKPVEKSKDKATSRSGAPLTQAGSTRNLLVTTFLDVAQPGQSACFGSMKSEVRILSSRSMECRSMVGHRPVKAVIGVRVPAFQLADRQGSD